MIEFFTDGSNLELFKREFLNKILENYLNKDGEICNENAFNDFNVQMLNLDWLEDRKFLIPFNNWKRIQTSENPIVQNIFWNVCDTNNLAHHEIRDSINEVHSNAISQGNTLISFIYTERMGTYCCFWLYSKNNNQMQYFNSSVIVLPRIGEIFTFNKSGMCINK